MVRAIPKALQLGKRESYDLIHCHFILPDGLAALWLRRKLGIPLAVTAHGSDVPGYNPDRFRITHKVISPAWRAIVRAIDRIVCPSEYLENLLLTAEPKAKTKTIPNGFDIDRFNPTRARKDSILVLTRMLERKGVQDVLHALAKPGIDLDINIVGTGPYLDTLVKLDKRLATNAKFHGWLDNDSEELRNLLEESSIFVFPSHAENFPLVLLEAMAAGAAIITTDQTGCREVVGDTALQVPPGNPEAIRKALESLVSDSNLRESLGRAARRRLEENFGWPSVTDRYISTYLELTGNG
jgi:glycosyltransferase involved in cell wall biosynthesis